MKNRTLALAALTLLSGWLPSSAPVFAWDYHTCLGGRLQWGSSSISFRPANLSFPAGVVRTALESALASWNTAPGTVFRFSTVYESVTSINTNDGKNSIVFSANYSGLGPNTLAVTTYQHNCFNITEKDVIFNANKAWTYTLNPAFPPNTSSPFDFALVATHELGHGLGLDHQASSVGTMNDIYPNGGSVGNSNTIQPLADDVLGDRAGYGTCCSAEDVYASTYRSTSATQTNFIPAPGSVTAGQSVTFQATIGNRGTGTVNPLRVEYYLSTDRFIDRNDTLLGAATFSLGSGFAGTHSATVTIPGAQAPGSYYLGWIVDPLGSVAEVDETNNAVALVGSMQVQAASACGEASCVPVQGAYISHFTAAGCTGTESYYLPYDGYGFSCRTWNGTGTCGTIQRTVTNRSYRHNGTCFDAWPTGNTLSEFVTVYR